MPRLIATKGPSRGREYLLEELCVFGRSPGCQIYIGDLTVSREHARVVHTERGYVLEDLGSGNGTWVNDQRISQHLLADCDEIRISESVFTFTADEPAAPHWVNMVTVVAGSAPGLLGPKGEPAARLFQSGLHDPDEDLRAELARAHRMLETLYAVTDVSSSMLEPMRLFNRILDCLLHVFPDAELGYIMLLDENGELVPGAIRRQSGTERAPVRGLAISQSVISQVMQEGKAVLGTGTNVGQGTLSTNGPLAARMCAPLLAQGKARGILYIEGIENGRPFTEEDLMLLSGVGRLAGVAIMNASLHQRLMRQQRLEQDLRFAKRIQQSFLPLEPPELPGYRFSRRYNPLFEVGGDFYDFIPLPNQRIGVAIGDISGKGVSAALLMARLTSDLRYFAIAEADPARVLDRVNGSLLATLQDNMFATVLYLVLDRDGCMTVSNAGHVPPLILRATGNQAQVVDEATGLAIGVLADPVFEQTTVQLDAGDSVVLCTDGLLEAKNSVQEEYGFDRLRRALVAAANSSTNLLDNILKDLTRFAGTAAQYDDLTMVAFTRLG